MNVHTPYVREKVFPTYLKQGGELILVGHYSNVKDAGHLVDRLSESKKGNNCACGAGDRKRGLWHYRLLIR